MLKRRINLKNELIAPLLDSLKKHLTLREKLKNVVHLENAWRHHQLNFYRCSFTSPQRVHSIDCLTRDAYRPWAESEGEIA